MWCIGHIAYISRINYYIYANQSSVVFIQMQLASHTNIAMFVGACLMPDNNQLLMEYCPRGSLQVRTQLVKQGSICLLYSISTLYNAIYFSSLKFHLDLTQYYLEPRAFLHRQLHVCCNV